MKTLLEREPLPKSAWLPKAFSSFSLCCVYLYVVSFRVSLPNHVLIQILVDGPSDSRLTSRKSMVLRFRFEDVSSTWWLFSGPSPLWWEWPWPWLRGSKANLTCQLLVLENNLKECIYKQFDQYPYPITRAVALALQCSAHKIRLFKQFQIFVMILSIEAPWIN